MKKPICELSEVGLQARYHDAWWAEAASEVAFASVGKSGPNGVVLKGMLPEIQLIEYELACRVLRCRRRCERLASELKRRGLPVPRW